LVNCIFEAKNDLAQWLASTAAASSLFSQNFLSTVVSVRPVSLAVLPTNLVEFQLKILAA